MIRRLTAVAALVAFVALTALMAACAGSPGPAAPTATTPATPPAAVAPVLTVSDFVGVWGEDDSPGASVFTAGDATAEPVCRGVEFRIDRDADSRSANVVFAASCVAIRLRVEGKGLMTGNALLWRAQGRAQLADGTACPVAFGDGSRAERTADGVIRVTYKGTVCDREVAGSVLARRK
jgi:hypothetical protein